jgi:hypothetical protein
MTAQVSIALTSVVVKFNGTVIWKSDYESCEALNSLNCVLKFFCENLRS